MRRVFLGILLLTALAWASGFTGCDSGTSGTPDGDDPGCPDGQHRGPDGNCHDVVVPPDGDKPDGDKPDGDKPDGDQADGDQTDGDQTDGDQTDGDQTDGDQTDGDQTDGDQTDGDQTDGDQTDGDQTDGDQNDGDQTDGDQPDGDQPDGDQPDGDQTDGDFETGPCGGTCISDSSCNLGCYCSNQGQCVKDCERGLEWLCGSLCCNYRRGRCEACPDGDEDGDTDDLIFCDTHPECPLYFFCNALGICQSDCDLANPCQDGFYCSERGQCLPLDEDDEDDTKTRQVVRACVTRADCPDGEICDWVNKVCVPGCRQNSDCPPESPSCSGGICF